VHTVTGTFYILGYLAATPQRVERFSDFGTHANASPFGATGA